MAKIILSKLSPGNQHNFKLKVGSIKEMCTQMQRPEGSTLGPLLLFINVNDITKSSHTADVSFLLLTSNSGPKLPHH